MILYDICLNQNEEVIYAGCEEADSPNAAIEQARQYAQLPYNRALAYDAYDESYDAKPLLEKVIIN